jgi:hypothetical protein
MIGSNLWRSQMKLNTKLCMLALSGLLLCIAQRLEAQNPLPYLQKGFTQTLFGTAPYAGTIGLGGVAFASNGDVLVDYCGFSGSPLFRFVYDATEADGHGGLVHPVSSFPSNAGCGLTNRPDDETLYSNSWPLGVQNLDANTGAVLRSNLGLGGDSLGITVDPQTKNIVYVGAKCFGPGFNGDSNCPIYSLNPDPNLDTHPLSEKISTFATVQNGYLIDGIAFDPSGNFLFLSVRRPRFYMLVLDRSGNEVQRVPMTSEPDGIAFHVNPDFVVTNNTDVDSNLAETGVGTMTRFDFPSNDFTQTPTQTLFASGGFRGDLSQVGPDGCLYATQRYTRFGDGFVDKTKTSIVQICPNFVPPPGVYLNVGHMTGGGRVLANETTVTHGFELYCDTNKTPNNLEINWGNGNKFHLENLLESKCSYDPSVSPNVPDALFNKLVGSASGSYNGLPGATAEFTFTDAGEPGKRDLAKIVIKLGDVIVLSMSGDLERGNHQVHAH